MSIWANTDVDGVTFIDDWSTKISLLKKDKDNFSNNIQVEKLTCNYLEQPLGVDTPWPELSWQIKSKERRQYQTAYRIIVSTDNTLLEKNINDLWDSGKVESDKSVLIKYSGIKPVSRQKCWWKVCVWDREGKQSPWSNPAFWEMGMLKKSDWKAKWIAFERKSTGIRGVRDFSPAPMFRKSFKLYKKIISARAYICGLGFYELYVNGEKIGKNVLSPGFTIYDRTVLYETHDITGALRKGDNVLASMLGNGWYNSFFDDAFYYKHTPWRDHPKLLVQVHIRFEDGEECALISDSSWLTCEGPVVYDSIKNGEVYDGRMEIKDWNRAECDDGNWRKAQIARPPGGVLKSAQMQPTCVMGVIRPVSLREVRKGVWVYDAGKNISGWARIKVKGKKGDTIVMKYAERLKEDGDIDQSGIDTYVKGGEFQTDRYILKGSGEETWEPRFTYHGFQYVQVSGYSGELSLDSLSVCMVHISFNDRGEFSCSNYLLNKIQESSKRTTLSNFHSYPTDCPHREKNGWTGDAHLSAEQTIFNFDPMTAYTKWMGDFIDVQRPSGQLPCIIPTNGWGYNWGSGPAWDSAIILIPWYLYLYCGDEHVLRKMYANMKLYMDFLSDMSEDYIVDFGLGDWCHPLGNLVEGKCPRALTDTAYYFSDACIVSKIAEILGDKEDKKYFEKLAEKIFSSFRKRFMDEKAGSTKHNCQTSISCVLYQGLAEKDERECFMKSLEEEVIKTDNHIDCGILGAKYIMHALTLYGRADLAYKIAAQTTYPGWGYWIEQGATTLWESWSGNLSLNHHIFSDISAWFFKGLAGINPDPGKPGFKHIIIKPNPVGDLVWVNARHDSMYGRICSKWRKEGNNFKINVTIPTNCTATIYLPCSDVRTIRESEKKLEGTEEVNLLLYEEGIAVLTVGSGTYKFTSDTG